MEFLWPREKWISSSFPSRSKGTRAKCLVQTTKCLVRSHLKANLLLQIGQEKSFSPEWIFSCCFKLDLYLKRVLQTVHEKFYFVNRNWCLKRNSLYQMLHLCVFSSTWVFMDFHFFLQWFSKSWAPTLYYRAIFDGDRYLEIFCVYRNWTFDSSFLNFSWTFRWRFYVVEKNKCFIANGALKRNFTVVFCSCMNF